MARPAVAPRRHIAPWYLVVGLPVVGALLVGTAGTDAISAAVLATAAAWVTMATLQPQPAAAGQPST